MSDKKRTTNIYVSLDYNSSGASYQEINIPYTVSKITVKSATTDIPENVFVVRSSLVRNQPVGILSNPSSDTTTGVRQISVSNTELTYKYPQGVNIHGGYSFNLVSILDVGVNYTGNVGFIIEFEELV